MSDSSSSHSVPPTSDDVWLQVESLLDEIAQLARAEIPSSQFHAALLDRLVQALAAVGAAMWTCDESGQWRRDYQINLDTTLLTCPVSDQQRHANLLAEVALAGETRLVPPMSGRASAANPTPYLLLFAPVMVNERVIGVIEVLQRPELQPDLQRGYLRIVSAASDLAEDFHRGHQLRNAADRESWWRDYGEFATAVHQSLDLKTTAYTIATEGRRILKCDRLSVLVNCGARYQLLAVSGVDTVQRRSDPVRRLEQLASKSMCSQEPLWHPTDTDGLPPELTVLLERYLDASHSRMLALIPLTTSPLSDSGYSMPAGVLVIERWEGEADDGLRDRLAAVRGHAALALGNALENHNVPFYSLLKLLRGARWYTRWRQLPKTVTVAITLAVLALVLILVPADFEISARGELQPQRRFHVFAPHDGIVVALPRAENETVRRGEPVATLRSPQLDLQFSELEGRRRTLREQLDAVSAARMSNAPPAEGAASPSDLSAQEEQLQEELKSLDQQYRIVRRQQSELDVKSPADGLVLTWDLQRSLSERPVKRGDQLMTIAQLDGAWEAQLRIDDDQAGHVMAARDKSGPHLPVSFVLVGRAGRRHEGRLQTMATTTDVDQTGQPVVHATMDLAGVRLPDSRPGARIQAKIHCGRRPLGYVWFRSLFEAIQSRLWF